MSARIPEPHEFWDEYCAKKEAARQAELKEARCHDCANYHAAPREITTACIGWCSAFDEFAEGGDCPAEIGCEDYEVL